MPSPISSASNGWPTPQPMAPYQPTGPATAYPVNPASLPGGAGDTFSPTASQGGPGGVTPPNSPASSRLNGVQRPLNAQEMGQKIVTLVTNYMQENPALLEKLNTVDMDELAQDIGPKVEGIRAQVQQALKKIPKGLDNRLIRMLDPGMQEVANDVDQWLRKEPDPAVMAELKRKQRVKAQEEAMGGSKPSAASSPSSLNDPFAEDALGAEDPLAGDPLAEEELLGAEPPLKTQKTSFKDKIISSKDKLVDKAQSSWPLNRNKPSDLGGLEEEPVSRPRQRVKPTGSGEGEISDAELEALLGGGGSDGLAFQSKKRQAP